MMIFLSYNYVKTPLISISDVETSDMDDTTYKFSQEHTKDSWLGLFKKDLNQKSYFYAVPEIQLMLN